MEIILPISLRLNFTANTLGFYGLIIRHFSKLMKLRISMKKKILSISLELNLTPKTLGYAMS